MERKVRDSCGKSVAKGDPAVDAEGGPPQKANIWSGNPRSDLLTLKNVRNHIP
ncbi:hypothetical protein RCO48_17690 [Peribacillus frigoritolerans]|nr:hypothetical protein [Peribacillus frigoritolerans]